MFGPLSQRKEFPQDSSQDMSLPFYSPPPELKNSGLHRHEVITSGFSGSEPLAIHPRVHFGRRPSSTFSNYLFLVILWIPFPAILADEPAKTSLAKESSVYREVAANIERTDQVSVPFTFYNLAGLPAFQYYVRRQEAGGKTTRFFKLMEYEPSIANKGSWNCKARYVVHRATIAAPKKAQPEDPKLWLVDAIISERSETAKVRQNSPQDKPDDQVDSWWQDQLNANAEALRHDLEKHRIVFEGEDSKTETQTPTWMPPGEATEVVILVEISPEDTPAPSPNSPDFAKPHKVRPLRQEGNIIIRQWPVVAPKNTSGRS